MMKAALCFHVMEEANAANAGAKLHPLFSISAQRRLISLGQINFSWQLMQAKPPFVAVWW